MQTTGYTVSRVTSLNQHNVSKSYANVEIALARGISRDRFQNVDESGFTTVQRSPGVIAEKAGNKLLLLHLPNVKNWLQCLWKHIFNRKMHSSIIFPPKVSYSRFATR
jgi:hypothetical protein